LMSRQVEERAGCGTLLNQTIPEQYSASIYKSTQA
jgi:hypothetical protein